MSPKLRDWLLVVSALVVALASIAGVTILVRSHELAQRAFDQTKESGTRIKRIEANAIEIADDLREKPVQKGLDRFHYNCYTNAHEATCQLTNTGSENAVACAKGVVTRKNSSLTAESLNVCTGTVKPLESHRLQAIFAVNAVTKLCPSDSGYGGVDWEKCTFEMIDMTTAANKTVKAEP